MVLTKYAAQVLAIWLRGDIFINEVSPQAIYPLNQNLLLNGDMV